MTFKSLLIKQIAPIYLRGRNIYIFLVIFNSKNFTSWILFSIHIRTFSKFNETRIRLSVRPHFAQTFLRNSFFRAWKRYLRNNFDAIGNVCERGSLGRYVNEITREERILQLQIVNSHGNPRLN